MNRRRWLTLAACVLLPSGCVSQQARLQSDDTGAEKDRGPSVRTLGDVTAVSNAEVIPVAGVGLVVGLDGTGGTPPGPERQAMEDLLKKKGFDNARSILDSPLHAVVRVAAIVPAGALKGDAVDVEVSLPPNSKATSLRGGTLAECQLYSFNSARNVSPEYAQSGRPDLLLSGNALVKAEGPVLTGLSDDKFTSLSDRDESDEGAVSLKKGRVWSGGRVLAERPFFLSLNPGEQRARVAAVIAQRINESFPGPKTGSAALATAHTKELVSLKVPAHYRHNLSRYLRVVRMIPLDGLPSSEDNYRIQLEENLLDPAHTLSAALRLEALGPESVAALKPALNSAYPLVRFAAAEALAYLGQPCSGEELARLATEHPEMQAYCLTALSSLNEAVSHVKLQELLTHETPELRYGSFRALRVMDDTDPLVRGVKVNDSYWVHRVGGDAPGLIHVLGTQRPEIVLFGKEPSLKVPFSFQAGPEFTVTANKGEPTATIARFSARHGVKRVNCGLTIEDLLRGFGKLGATYADAVEFLRQAEIGGVLTCELAIDAVPQAATIYELAKLGQENPTMRPGDGGPLGDGPNLYEKPSVRQRQVRREPGPAVSARSRSGDTGGQ